MGRSEAAVARMVRVVAIFAMVVVGGGGRRGSAGGCSSFSHGCGSDGSFVMVITLAVLVALV